MKKLNPEKLRNAFDIPAPERKKEFLASHGDKFISRKKSDPKSVLMRFASAMALAVLFVCLLGVMKPEHDLRKNVGTDNIIIETTGTSTAAPVTTTEAPPLRTTTTAWSTEPSPASSTVTTVISTKPDVTVTSAVTAITATDETFTKNTSTAASTAKPTAAATRKSTSKTTARTTTKSTSKIIDKTTTKSTAKTSASVTIIASTSSQTTSSTSASKVIITTESDIPIITTTTSRLPVSDDNGTNTRPTGSNIDYSIIPDIIYTPTDNIYDINTNDPAGGYPWDLEFGTDPDLVISGTIVDMIYTRIGNQPYTQFNVEIDSFIMGDSRFKKGYTISFYVRGGYMPAREFFELFPNELPYDLEITDDLTVFDAGELNDKYYPGKQGTFKLDKSGSVFPENTFIIHKY